MSGPAAAAPRDDSGKRRSATACHSSTLSLLSTAFAVTPLAGSGNPSAAVSAPAGGTVSASRIAPRTTRDASPAPSRTKRACRTWPRSMRTASRAGTAVDAPSSGPIWTRSGKLAAAALPSGCGSSMPRPASVLVTPSCGAPPAKTSVARYAAWPLSGRRATTPSSAALRSASAVATPWPLKRCVSPCRALEGHLAAVDAGAAGGDAEGALREIDLRPGRGEQRRIGRHAHVVAGQAEAALDAGQARIVERDGEGELEVGAAAAARRLQRTTRPAADRRRVDVAQHLGKRAAGAALDLESRMVAELRDRAVDAAPVGAAETRLGVADLRAGCGR